MGKYEQPRRKKVRKKRSGRGLTTGLIVAASVLAALIIGFVGYAVTVAKSDTIFPNVYVAGVDVGGMTREEATEAVQAAVDSTYGISTLVVKLPDRTLNFEPEDTKVSLDVAGAIDEAWNYGRDAGVFDALSHRLSPGSNEQYINIEDSLTLDEDYVRTTIDAVASEIHSERQDSTYEPHVSQTTGEDGTAGTPVVTGLTIQVGRSQRSLDADTLYEMVVSSFMNNDFTPLEFDYDEAAYTPVDLDSLYEELCSETKDAYYDAETKEIVPETVGYGFDLAAAKQRQAMAEDGSTLDIEFSTIEPKVTKETLQEKLFSDVIGQYDSPHVANYARTNNLDLACKAIDGTVLNPGDIFSFNDTVGERTAAKGYQAATVYVSGESKPETGGGVCQVASTIYVACILADLNVTERSEHMFLVDYVPRGADATIYWGSLDFKFENSTSYPIRIDASVSDGYVHIALVGTKETDETIKLEPETTATIPFADVTQEDETKPEDYRQVIQTPYTGYNVTLYIQRYDADGNPIGEREPAQHPHSRYRKRDRITVVGVKKDEEEKPPEEDPNGSGALEPPVDPTTPTTPTEPTAPAEPTVPTEPTTPTEPTAPTEPTTPTEPTDPTEPTIPTEPTTPVEPEPELPPNPFEEPPLDTQ